MRWQKNEAPPTLKEVFDGCLWNAHVAAKAEQLARTKGDRYEARKAAIEQRHWREYAAYYRREMDEHPERANLPLRVPAGIMALAPRPTLAALPEPDRRLPPEPEDEEKPECPF